MGLLSVFRRKRLEAPPPSTALLKQSRTLDVIAQPWMAPQGVPRPETIATFEDFGRAFKREVWVFACVKRIAEAAADVPMQVRRVQRDGTEEPIDRHPLLDLLHSINPYMGQALFMETLFAGVELMGNAYIEKVRKTTTGPPVELYPLRPDRMRIVPDPKAYIGGFLYDVNGRKIAFETNDVIHVKTYHPLDDYYGLSTLEAAALSVENDQYSIAYNRNFFRNNALPAGIFVTADAVKQDDVERIKAEFEKLFKGVKNAHRVGWLSGSWQWVDMGLKQRDAQFIDSRKLSREEILAAFGVPPVLVGIFEFANYANSREQIQIFWKTTMLPRLQRIEDQLNEQLAPEYGEDIRIRFDLSEIEALREDQDARATRLRGLVQDGIITRNEAREQLGLQRRDEQAMDLIFLPFTLAPIGGFAPSPAQPAEDQKARLRLEEEVKTARWREFMNDVAVLEAPMAAALRSVFTRQREQVMRRFHDAVIADTLRLSGNGAVMVKQRVTLEQIQFDALQAERELEQVATRTLAAAVERRGSRLLATLGVDVAFNLADPRVTEFLQRQVFKFKTGINETTREAIRAALIAGERLGEGVTQIADRLNHVFEEANQVRALRIARTETLGAANFGQLEGMAQSGVVRGKQWLSARDSQVRASHRDLDAATDPSRGGAPTALMEPFGNGLMFPGDQTGPPEEVVNCRCALLEVVGRER